MKVSKTQIQPLVPFLQSFSKLLILTLFACDYPVQSSSAKVPTPRPRPSIQKPAQDPALTCEGAGGKFDSARHLCICDSYQSFSAWSSQCADLRDAEGMITLGSSTLSTIALKEGKWIDADLKINRHFGAPSFQIASLPGQINYRLIQSSQGSAPLNPLLETEFFYKSLTNSQIALVPREGNAAVSQIYFVSSKETDPMAVLATPMTSLLENLPQPMDVRASYDEDMSPILSVLAQMTRFDLSAIPPTSHSAAQCGGMCEIQGGQSFPDLGLIGTRYQSIVGGAIFQNRIWVTSPDSPDLARALAIFTPSGKFSHLYLFSKPSMDNKGNLSLEVSLFDPSLKRVGAPHSRPRMLGFRTLQAMIATMDHSPLKNRAPQMVICESGFTPQTIQYFDTSKFLVGPRPSSLFGWLNPPTPLGLYGSGYFSGALSIDVIGGVTVAGDLSQHTQNVVGNVQTSVIPIGLDSCLDRPETWIPTVLSNSKARTVSLSATSDYDRSECPKTPLAAGIRQSKNELLWVVAAGNDGLNLDTEETLSCPLTLQESNLLVVGSGGARWRDYFSNFGVKTVDILADGRSEQNFEATSFATPRVADLTALIQNQYPQFAPAEVKMVLLASADTNFDYPAPVRSGGSLDSPKAKALAKSYSKNRNIYSALEDVYSSYTYKKRIAFMKERGIIP